MKKLLKENEELKTRRISRRSAEANPCDHHQVCLLQKDRKIGILRKHIAMKRELAQQEQERLRRDTEIRQRENEGYNGTCR